jgi:diaminohydroxyphosphoribosylaminopyrimidine deaminase/5-amino-6-(5-phosphoribosylamino)uracil reductase
LQAAGDARGAAAYVTLEPCCHVGRTPPCADALLAAGVSRVVCASADPNPRVSGGGIARLGAAGVQVAVGLRAAAARNLNPGFFSRFERGRPFIRLKLAMSLDGRTAPAAALQPTGGPPRSAPPAGAPQWITGEQSRHDVQQWRARSSAVLTGAGTVRADDPRLDVRWQYGPWVRQPLRVVLDSSLACAATSKVYRDGHALIFAAPDAAGAGVPGVRIERVPRAARGLDLHAVAARLAELEVNELFVECGARLAAGFLEADLVDELVLYVAPHVLGADAAPLAAVSGLADAAMLPRFEYRDQRLIGADLRLLLTPRRD